MNQTTRWISALLLVLTVCSPTYAVNILITNDDGYAAPNIQALYAALKAQGHDVIMSAPSEDQSGTSASMNWFQNVTFHTDPSNADINLVDGTPAMAVLYGLEILSKARWGTYPDLVISGPNEGNNIGILTNHSGTVGAAVTALYRGIPAVAVSADRDTDVDGTEEMVAQATLKVINAMLRRTPILPPGTGINLNIPSLVDTGSADDIQFVFSSIGTSGASIPKFTLDLGRDEGFLTFIGYWPTHYPDTYESYHDVPGITIGNAEDLGSLKETAKNPESELLNSGKATISVINVTYAAGTKQERLVQSKLRPLVCSKKKRACNK